MFAVAAAAAAAVAAACDDPSSLLVSLQFKVLYTVLADI